MVLQDVRVEIRPVPPPPLVADYLTAADGLIELYVQAHPVSVTGFVASNPETVTHVLRQIKETHLATGDLFCEWGSGLGVIASLAALVGYRACGIEIDAGLHAAARDFAATHNVAVDLVLGSFVPPGAEPDIEEAMARSQGEFIWLDTNASDAYRQLGWEPDDFDLVFAYPWPGEEHLIQQLFDRCASTGALLLTFNQYNSVRLQRKMT